MKNIYLTILLGFLLAGGSAWSQDTASAIQNGTQPGSPAASPLGSSGDIKNIPELYAGETNDFGTQQLVKEKTQRKWIELNLNWQFGYNDNYLLANIPTATVSGGKLQSTQMLSTWDLAFAPDPFTYDDMKLYPRIGFRQSFWNYGIGTGQNSNFAAYDFDTQTVYGETRADLGDGWSTTLGADATRITSSYSDSEIYRQMGPRWGFAKQFQINDYNLITVSFDQQYLFTEVPSQPAYNVSANIYDRFNTTVGASYIWSPLDRLYVVPFYRLVYSWYPQYEIEDANPGEIDKQDRSDFTNTVGLSTTYQYNDYLSFRVFVSYEKRYTTYSNTTADPNDINVPQYGNFQAGMGGGVTFRF